MKKTIGLLGLAALGLAGCAKGPDGTDGGPDNGQAVNRMTVSMTLAQPVNRNYFYDFAFDDDGDISDGPRAIVGPTTLFNGVVGGSFTVLVQFHAGTPIVYRRTRINSGDDNIATETLQVVPNAFVVQPTVQNGRTITFTLNLDATYTDRDTQQEVRLFRNANGNAPQSLNINFVTTDEQRRDPNLQGSKSYDAFSRGVAGTYFTISDVRLSQNYTNQSSGVQEPAGDVIVGNNSRNLVPSQIDITDFSINILRGTN